MTYNNLDDANKRIEELEAIPTEGGLGAQTVIVKAALDAARKWFQTDDQDKDGVDGDDIIERLAVFAEALPRANRDKIALQARIDLAVELVDEYRKLRGCDMNENAEIREILKGTNKDKPLEETP